MITGVSEEEVGRIVQVEHEDPFQVLGMHLIWEQGRQVVSVRVFLPGAVSVFVLDGDAVVGELVRRHPSGLYEAEVAGRSEMFAYRLEVVYADGLRRRMYDPYAFLPMLSDFDMHLFNESTHLQIYEKLGAHPTVNQDVPGVLFAVWAPNAQRVSVVGSFNEWDGRVHSMRTRGNSGVWELFVPELTEGEFYKFEILTKQGHLLLKTDPYGLRMELRPQTASIVHKLSDTIWTDEAWMAARAKSDPYRSPMTAYEVHPGSWKRVPEEGNRSLSYRELAHELVPYVLEMGYTHIELMPVMEHPLDESWGYQVTGYYAPSSRYGTPEDFQYFVNYCHTHKIGVILDWVPAHFPRDSHSLGRFDGTALYEHDDPRLGLHPDWDTLIFNYGRNEVRNFLCSNALFWLDKYHVDGLRVDAVASMLYLDYSREEGEWVPNRHGGRENLEAISFFQFLNEKVYARFPGALMCAEESTSWPGVSRPAYLGGLGFGFKWNMGWMNDTLRYMSLDPVYRKYEYDRLTFGRVYAFYENFILVLSHDEVVHGKRSMLDKMPGDVWQKFANLRLLYTFMYGHPGKKLLFMGCEFGQWKEWDHRYSLDWHLLDAEPHRGLQKLVQDLNQFYRQEPALYETDFDSKGFDWIDCHDADQSTVTFSRQNSAGDPPLIVACNFTPVPRYGYRIGVPKPGFYREVLNSDSALYGGSNLGNTGGVQAQDKPSHGHSWSLEIVLPPLAGVIFKREEAPGQNPT